VSIVTLDTREAGTLPFAKRHQKRRFADSRKLEVPTDRKRRNLENLCRYAADALTGLDWGHAETGVRAVVEEMVANAHVSRDSVFWLLVESAKLPQQTEAVCYLNELAAAIQQLRPERLSRRSLF
jgi:hypothetical protein